MHYYTVHSYYLPLIVIADTELSNFVLTHLPDRHIHIMRHDTGTYLVYGNGSFTHGQPDGDNHIFRVEFEIDGQVIALKAVNHKHENRIDLGSGSGMEAEEGEDMTDTMVVESECYLAISQEGKPFCHPSKFTETPILDILFVSPCFN